MKTKDESLRTKHSKTLIATLIRPISKRQHQQSTPSILHAKNISEHFVLVQKRNLFILY